ncbi:hypothetical protein ACFYUY_04435 [Kitasatospora sp. NPDC004745]|uniref:hypothetical protein n=1 Tax=Kitasatospora sp. NPDC004745 TaxID=3364019 RepID=UPI0036CAE54D
MPRRLATAVHIDHPTTGERLLLQPGDEPEPEVADRITHPDAWEPDDDVDAEQYDDEDDDEPDDDGPEDTPAPRRRTKTTTT